MVTTGGDYILHATAAGANIRGFFARTTGVVGTAARIHGTSPVVSAALGRLLTAGAIMGSMLKNDGELVSLQMKGDGPMGGLVVSCGPDCVVKGYPHNPRVDLPLNNKNKLDVAGAIGRGHLSVVRDLAVAPFSGIVELVSGEVAEDLTHYFAHSEQQPSSVGLGVLVKVADKSILHAGGFIIQILPGCPPHIPEELERIISDLPPITTLMHHNYSPDDIASRILGGFGLSIKEYRETRFGCNCSFDRTLAALASLGRKELTNILNEDGQATLHCHFCKTDHHFDSHQIKGLLEEQTT